MCVQEAGRELFKVRNQRREFRANIKPMPMPMLGMLRPRDDACCCGPCGLHLLDKAAQKPLHVFVDYRHRIARVDNGYVPGNAHVQLPRNVDQFVCVTWYDRDGFH